MGGMRLDNFEARTGLNATVLRPRLAVAQARGWIRLHGSEVHPTELGMQQLNALLMLFC
jgi:coproporphyrinogen III oxidase-like Fe-S oxidoreductase